MTNLEKINEVNKLLIEVIKDEEQQAESSLSGLKDVVLSILADYWLNVKEPEIFMANTEIEIDEFTDASLSPH